MKKIAILIVMLLINIITYSQIFTYNGINYSKLNSNVVKVDTNSVSITGEITIPDSVIYNDTSYVVKEIGQYAFYNCKQITKVNLPMSLELIDTGAFNKTMFDSITIPDSVSKIGMRAFAENMILKYIKLPFKLLTIEEITFDNCEKLHTVIFNPNLTKIENIAFSCCYLLDSVDLPESVIDIHDSAFFNCGMNIVFFAPQQINNFAFGDCFNLTQIYSKTETPPTIMENSFSGINPEAKVFVCGNPIDYKNTIWGQIFDTIKNAPINLCTSELTDIIDNIKINIYPNPTTNYIEINTTNQYREIKIYDINGKLISINYLVNGYVKIDTSLFKNGVYILKIDNITKKIIKL